MSGTRLRQSSLFLVALILPSLVIAGLGWKLRTSEREVRRNQEEKAREKERDDIGRAVSGRLEGIRTTAQPGPGQLSGPLVVVGRWDDGNRFVPQWQDVTTLRQFSYSGLSPEAERLLREARRAEVDKNYAQAADLYRQLVPIAQEGAQRAFAQDGMARTLVKSGANAGLDVYRRELLTLPSSVVDENRDPFAYWAATALAASHTVDSQILDRIEQDLESPSFLTQELTSLWLEVAAPLERSNDGEVRTKASALLDRMRQWKEFLEQVAGMQAWFLTANVTADVWKAYGENDTVWFVSMAVQPGAKPLVVVVRAHDVLRSVESEGLSGGTGRPFQFVSDGTGEPLNDRSLPNLRVVFRGPAVTSDGSDATSLFFGFSLLVVVSLTSLAGYFAWRDTRREIRLAEMRSQFVASVSHELKTPLTSIRMFAELLEMRPATEPTQAEYLNTIVNESERLTRLLNNVLDFSRIEHGQKSYAMDPAPLDEVVRSAVRVMEYPLKAQGFDLRLETDGSMPALSIDRDAIKQAVLNLLTNAMKYSGKSRSIELRVRSDDGDAVIDVTDHGIGIPLHEQARIFDKFYRANVPENQAISGTGLGLALVAHIVNAHNGCVRVESRPGDATTFSIRLPLSPARLVHPAGPSSGSRIAENRASAGSAAQAGVEARS